MQEKRHDRVVEMRLCFFLGKVGDYNVSFVETRMCRSTINRNAEWALNTLARLEQTTERRPSVLEAMREQVAKTEPAKKQPAPSHDKESR